MTREAKQKLAIAGGAAGVIGITLYLVTRDSAAPKKTPPVPTREPPGGGAGIQVGKPGATVGPGPFDPVSSDWKRKNAPEWWPW